MLLYQKSKLLNLINLLKKNSTKISQGKGGNIRIHKRDVPMSKEWHNSLYSFNKNTIKILPSVYNHSFKLLKGYFNMTSDWMRNKKTETQARYFKIKRRSSGHKLWISNPEIKHYNDKINITIYIYNNTYNFYKKKLELFQFTWGSGLNNETLPSNKSNLIKFKLLKRQFPLYVGTNKTINDKSQSFYQTMVKWLKLNKHVYMTQYKSTILNLVKKNETDNLIKLLNNLKIQNYNYLINKFNKELLYLQFKQKMLFNEFKYNDMLLLTIIEYIQNIYKKNTELNIVTLKYFWLSTNILLQILTAKIKSSKNRGKYLLPLNYAMEKIKVPILSKNKFDGEVKPYVGIQNIKLNQFYYEEKDYLNHFLLINKRSKVWSNNDIDGLVLSNLENKIISGVFLNISGRLTKRYRAQRAVRGFKFKGTLKNVYSAHRNYSSSLLKGYSNINVEKTKMNSNVRIGAFGLTGWIASY